MELEWNYHGCWHQTWSVKYELRSTGLNLFPLLAMRCLYWGVDLPIWAQVSWTQVSSTLGHEMPLWGVDLPMVGLPNMSSGQLDQVSSTLGHQMPLPGGQICQQLVCQIWTQVNKTQVSSTLGHEMPLLGGRSANTWSAKYELSE